MNRAALLLLAAAMVAGAEGYPSSGVAAITGYKNATNAESGAVVAASGGVPTAGGGSVLTEEPVPHPVSPPAGTLTVTSQPPTAKWYLNGTFAGMTPGTMTGVVAGTHRVTVKVDGYEGWSQKVTVIAGGELQVSASLLPRQRPDPVSLTPNVGTGVTPAEAGKGQIWTDPTTGMDFLWIPGGCHLMGSPSSEAGLYSAEGPQHEVCVDSFWMVKTEVTNSQYRRYKPGHDSGRYEGIDINGDNQPVVRVSWNDAQEYSQWLSRSTGKQFRLPTEAEWEYAARGGTTQTRYWGDDPSKACGYANVKDQTARRQWAEWTTIHECSDKFAAAAHVGRFLPNNFGLYDMLGNAEELCADWFAPNYYAESALDNPTGPSSGVNRVARGGSWSYVPQYVRAASRNEIEPDDRGGAPPNPANLGFRLVVR
jgi:sulfatase modifying factor 1